MEEALLSRLVAALDPVPVRFGSARGSMPCVVLNVVSETAGFTHDGEDELHEFEVQADCYGTTYAAAMMLFRQLHEHMKPPHAFLEIARRSRETGTDEASRPYRVSADYRIFHAIA